MVPVALVISDFPIVRTAVCAVLAPRYRVEAIPWQALGRQPPSPLDLILLDVTTVREEAAVSSAPPLSPHTVMVVWSLHENDVRVYRAGTDGPELHARLPTLLAALA